MDFAALWITDFIDLRYIPSFTHGWYFWPSLWTVAPTGRQPPPPYSVLFRIISKRRCILPHNFSLEKNQVPRELTLIAISLACLAGGSMKFICWKLKMSYHCPAVVCHLFLYFFICAPTTAFTWLSKLWTLQLWSVFYLSWDLSPWCRVSFWKGNQQFQIV